MTWHSWFFVIYSVVILFDIRLNSLVVNNTPDLTSQMTKYLSATESVVLWHELEPSTQHQFYTNRSVPNWSIQSQVIQYESSDLLIPICLCYEVELEVWINLKMDSDVSRRWKAIKASVLPKLGSLTLARPKRIYSGSS